MKGKLKKSGFGGQKSIGRRSIFFVVVHRFLTKPCISFYSVFLVSVSVISYFQLCFLVLVLSVPYILPLIGRESFVILIDVVDLV